MKVVISLPLVAYLVPSPRDVRLTKTCKSGNDKNLSVASKCLDNRTINLKRVVANDDGIDEGQFRILRLPNFLYQYYKIDPIEFCNNILYEFLVACQVNELKIHVSKKCKSMKLTFKESLRDFDLIILQVRSNYSKGIRYLAVLFNVLWTIT